MAYVAVDKNKDEMVFIGKPYRHLSLDIWKNKKNIAIELPKGSIKKLIGRELTWEDEPVELKEEL
jgi:hypothetical protein